MNCHYLLYPCFYLIFLTSCATETIQQRNSSPSKMTQAESFTYSGQHEKAAQMYQTLAKSKPEYQDKFSLLAVDSHIQSGNNQSAQKLISTIKPSSLSTEQRSKLNLLSAQLLLRRGEAVKALDKLKITQVYTLQRKDQITYYQSLAFAHSLTENQLLSAQVRIELTQFLDTEEDRVKNNEVIFNTINLVPLETLYQYQSETPDILSGWVALSIIYKTSQSKQDHTKLQSDVYRWQRQNPQHPANSGFLDSLFVESSKITFKTPSSIAILLPESGRFAQAGQAIKKGFMEAFHQNHSDGKLAIQFYDSSAYNPADLYYQAISEGAELIIGPLSKENIQTLVNNVELSVPVLALNHIPGLVKDNLFQFGLSPIDESQQIATRASLKGIKNVLIIAPETNQGNRISNSLTEYWQNIEGVVLNSQLYNPKENDFSNPIKGLLNLNESKKRYNQLQRFLATEIHHKKRVRRDADAIFLIATPKIARSIYPQLRFYGATNIPVYSASNIYTGIPNPSLDQDLNKITFCDIPWLFPSSYSGDLDQESLKEIWQQIPNKYLRLVALGIDSFNLVNYLNQLDTVAYTGATGKLSLNMENRITRQLVCAKFVKGEAILQSPLYEENIIADEQNMIDTNEIID